MLNMTQFTQDLLADSDSAKRCPHCNGQPFWDVDEYKCRNCGRSLSFPSTDLSLKERAREGTHLLTLERDVAALVGKLRQDGCTYPEIAGALNMPTRQLEYIAVRDRLVRPHDQRPDIDTGHIVEARELRLQGKGYREIAQRLDLDQQLITWHDAKITRKNYHEWSLSADQLEKAEVLCAAGKNYRAIAFALRVTSGAVRYHAERNQWQVTCSQVKATPEIVRAVAHLRANGYSNPEISKQTRVSTTTIIDAANRHGWTNPPGSSSRRVSDEDLQELISLRDKGWLFKDLGPRYDITPSGARYAYIRAGGKEKTARADKAFYDPASTERFRQMYEVQGATLRDIAAKAGVTPETVRYQATRLEWPRPEDWEIKRKRSTIEEQARANVHKVHTKGLILKLKGRTIVQIAEALDITPAQLRRYVKVYGWSAPAGPSPEPDPQTSEPENIPEQETPEPENPSVVILIVLGCMVCYRPGIAWHPRSRMALCGSCRHTAASALALSI